METIIKEAIEAYVVDYQQPENRGWEQPLIAFASAGDPLFSRLKQIIHPGHALPEDLLEGAKSVITYFIPFHKQVINSNKQGRLCSKSWALSYIETNDLIKATGEHLCSIINAKGYHAVHIPATHNFNETTLLSDWSHRSAAYIAGLGTFGVNHMLITAKGCCGRIGSLITDLELKPTARPTTEYCLYLADGSCGICVDKCVNTALLIDSLDKHKCYEMCLTNAARFKDLEKIADVCGKCLVGLPCSTANPAQL
jgi:epoxyqueuosine reductase QueG